jgi:hypothetical protein
VGSSKRSVMASPPCFGCRLKPITKPSPGEAVSHQCLRGLMRADTAARRQPSCTGEREHRAYGRSTGGDLAGPANRESEVYSLMFQSPPMAKRNTQHLGFLPECTRCAFHRSRDRFHARLVFRVRLQFTNVLCSPRATLHSLSHLSVPLFVGR